MKSNRTTQPVTISLPPQLIEKAEKLTEASGMTRSEIFRDALQAYFDQLELIRLRRYGQSRAASLGIRQSDVELLVNEARAEYGRSNKSDDSLRQ